MEFWNSVDLTGNQTRTDIEKSPHPFWSTVDLAGNQANTICRLFDDEGLHVHDVMMFRLELLESHCMAQGMGQPAVHDAVNLRYSSGYIGCMAGRGGVAKDA